MKIEDLKKQVFVETQTYDKVVPIKDLKEYLLDDYDSVVTSLNLIPSCLATRYTECADWAEVCNLLGVDYE